MSNNKKTDPKTAESTAAESAPEKMFAPRKIYLKDVSFEAPATPTIFTQQEFNLTNDVNLLIKHTPLDKELGLYEVVLKAIVTAKLDEDVAYLAEVHQAGIFQINHPDPEAIDAALEINCPHVLLPFVREELNSVITKGGFYSFLLTGVNFETAYVNKKAEKQQQPSEQSPEKGATE